LIASASLPFWTRAWAMEMPRTAAVPGGVEVVDLGPGATRPLARFNRQRVMVLREAENWRAVVGIPLDSKPGVTRLLMVERPGEDPEMVKLVIGPANYSTQHLNVKPGEVDLSPSDLARYESERVHLLQVLRTYTSLEPKTLRLVPPCDGPRFNTFGRRRFFNGQSRRPHNGMDIAAPTGTPVLAAAFGEVIDVGNYLFSGNSVIVSHGQGFLTLYAHLSEVEVFVKNKVEGGMQIGQVGTTGRVTGPHLHFSVYLNAAAVDPGLFLPEA
jgi:murein DD-endopeptidase MepM/ murein hydrolase activator NlpD